MISLKFGSLLKISKWCVFFKESKILIWKFRGSFISHAQREYEVQTILINILAKSNYLSCFIKFSQNDEDRTEMEKYQKSDCVNKIINRKLWRVSSTFRFWRNKSSFNYTCFTEKGDVCQCDCISRDGCSNCGDEIAEIDEEK